MFRVVDIQSLLWPVEINVPKQDGSGEHDAHEIKVEYKVLDSDEQQKNTEALQLYLEKLRALADQDLSSAEVDRASKDLKEKYGVEIADYIVGWEDVFDADGESIKFSKSKLKQLMKIRYIETGITEGFRLCQEGYAAKNL